MQNNRTLPICGMVLLIAALVCVIFVRNTKKNDEPHRQPEQVSEQKRGHRTVIAAQQPRPVREKTEEVIEVQFGITPSFEPKPQE